MKGFTSKDTPRAILPPPPPKIDLPSCDVIVKAGDDDNMLNDDGMPDVFIEEEEEMEARQRIRRSRQRNQPVALHPDYRDQI